MSGSPATADLVDRDDQPPESESPLPAEPRLRIRHLLLWTAAAAVLMGLSRNWQDENTGLVASAGTVLWAGASSVDLGVTLLGCLWRRRGLPFFNQPGQVFALVSVIALLSRVLHLFADAIVGYGGGAPDERWVWLIYALSLSALSVVVAVICWWMWRRLADTSAWRWTLFFVLLYSVFGVFHSLLLLLSYALWSWWLHDLYIAMYYVSVPISLVIAAAIIVAASLDYRSNTQRHWTHWAPLASAFFGGAAGFLWLSTW